MSSVVPPSGRVFFSSVRRSLEVEDEICLTSVGVDIGSSTSHLAFSRLTLERLDNRYVVSKREVLYESSVLLTPYLNSENGLAASTQEVEIDAAELGDFIASQYASAELTPDRIDTGALILTGVAVRRINARAIGDLFAAQAGKFVAVSAGDALETTLAAFGSGAAAKSIRDGIRVMNVDIGGGTSKIAVCEDGEVIDLTAIDIGARIVSFDTADRVVRIEEAGLQIARELGISLTVGEPFAPRDQVRFAERLADRLIEAMRLSPLSKPTEALLRLAPLRGDRAPDAISISGGVAEFFYRRARDGFGDLGEPLATSLRARLDQLGIEIVMPDQGIRATVMGASQYTVQVSGSTIYVAPMTTLPIRNVPVVSPTRFVDTLSDESISVDAVADAIGHALLRLDLAESEQAIAMFYHWQGSATFARLDGFCRGLIRGMSKSLHRGLPLVLVGDSDVGGLVGIHCKEELGLANPVISIDGITLREFDFIDIGEMLEASGAVPVVIKSLVFPLSTAVGRAFR